MQADIGVTERIEKSHELGDAFYLSLLAQNKDTTKLKLRFFLVKIPTPIEPANGITAEQICGCCHNLNFTVS